MSEDKKYSEMLKELQGIVEGLGKEDCAVDQLEANVQRASRLISELRQRLERTENSVTEMLEEIDGGS